MADLKQHTNRDDDHKYPEASLTNGVVVEEEKEEDEVISWHTSLNDLHDAHDPSISDLDNNRSPKTERTHRDRRKSKSSSNVQDMVIGGIGTSNNNNDNKKETMDFRPRRHSESSSGSHSSEYRLKRNKHHQSTSTRNGHAHPHHLLPLNMNGQNKKPSSKKTHATSTGNSSHGSESPLRSSRFARSILSKYHSKKHSKKKSQVDDEKSSLGISGPVNVQHVIHVEWDDRRKAYKGLPDVWHSKIPQSVTVPTQELPVQFRDNRSVSLTQSVLQRAKSSNAAPSGIIVNHQPLPHARRHSESVPVPPDIDYLHGDEAVDAMAMPLPGPRVFISSLHTKHAAVGAIGGDDDIASQIPDFHGLLSTQVMSIADYLQRIGIDDLSKRCSVAMIRREFFLKMGFSKRDPLVHMPRHIQQSVLTYLDVKSYLRCCITCSDLASFLDDPIVWKIQVLYKSKVQGTLHRTNFRLRHRVWKSTYMSMVKIDRNPSYYDHVWNIVVAGDTKHGQDRLVVSLGRHWRCKLTGLEPVISAVNGTYRFGVDFVVRRVIIKDIIIKLQVWDGGHVMTDTSLLKTANIFLILFDLTKKDSFDRTLIIARSMMALLPTELQAQNDNVRVILVGNTTNNPSDRVISYDAAKRFANERGLMYLEANTDNTAAESINDAFVNLAEECIVYENEKAALKKALQAKETSNCLIQ